ncbi:MAG: hypothetical protein K0R65_1662 [Crocinitomicaceae bacterium]|jgi:hypothetical protein|nr:hypothetical protein [Crocinitomicaceae bacterium]
MKYSCEIKINKPIDEVIAKFDNIENMKTLDGRPAKLRAFVRHAR